MVLAPVISRFREDSLLAHLSLASATSMAVRVIGLGLAFLSHLILSRVLGASQYGTYVIALGWAMVLVIPARLGLDNSALRFATIYREEQQGSDFRGLVVFSLCAIGAMSLLIVSGLIAAKLAGVGPLRPIPMPLLIGLAMLIPFSAMTGWLSALIRTANRIFASQFYDQVLRPALLAVVIALFALSGSGLDAGRAMIATGLTVGIAMIGIAAHARASFRKMPAGRASFDHRHEWLSVSWVLFLMAVVQELLNQVDIILLGLVGNAIEAGHFAAAWRLASLVPFGLVAIATVSGPLIASAHNRRSLPELARVARLNARFSALFAFFMATLLAILGKLALGLFGPGFGNAYTALLILLAGGLVNSFTGSVGYLMIMTGHQRVALKILAGALALSIIINLLLIPALGAIGSAIASAAALSTWNLAMAAYVRRKIGVDATALGRPRRAIT